MELLIPIFLIVFASYSLATKIQSARAVQQRIATGEVKSKKLLYGYYASIAAMGSFILFYSANNLLPYVTTLSDSMVQLLNVASIITLVLFIITQYTILGRETKRMLDEARAKRK